MCGDSKQQREHDRLMRERGRLIGECGADPSWLKSEDELRDEPVTPINEFIEQIEIPTNKFANPTGVWPQALGQSEPSFTFVPVVWWVQTLGLRFVERELWKDDFHSQPIKILQQQWYSSDGRMEWRDVPVEKEG